MISPRAIRTVFLVAALAAPPALLATASPVSAGPCSGSAADQTVGLTCPGGDGVHDSTGADADADWDVVDGTQGGPCIYTTSDGIQVSSYYATIRNLNTGETRTNYCVAQVAGAGATNAMAKKVIPNPVPDSDYKAEFLVGAPITFTSTNMANYTVTVPGFPNAKAVVTATDVKWDFGDGQTSTDLEPTHVYESIAPNASKKDQHNVTVTVTGTWKAVLLDNTTGTETDLGSVTGTGSFDRSLVQVWSKQTEPNS